MTMGDAVESSATGTDQPPQLEEVPAEFSIGVVISKVRHLFNSHSLQTYLNNDNALGH